MTVFYILLGVVVGYIFKPQIDKLMFAIVKMFRGKGGS